MEVDNEIFIFGNDTLSHHGIKGQEWGERNGPPYPLSHRISAAIKKRKKKNELKKKIKDRGNLTDEEIDKLTNRLIMEKKLKDAYLNNDTAARISKENREAVAKAVRDMGSKTMVAAGVVIGTAAAVYYAAKVASKKDPELGDAILKGLGTKKKK